MLIIDSDEELDASLTQELVEIAGLNGQSDAGTISHRLGARYPSRTDTANAERPLGAREQLFWLLDQNRPFHFAMVAQIAGKAGRDEWRRALDRVQGRHPRLSCCIEGAPGSVPWFRQHAGAKIPLRIVAGAPKTDWQRTVGEELAMPVDSSAAPLVRAVLIEGESDTALILVAHHAIADGLSLAYAIRDTLAALSGAPLEPLAALPAQEDMFGLGDAGVGEPHAPAGVPARYRPQDGAVPEVIGLCLPRFLTRKLRHRARQMGTTVHGALSAAIAIAGRRVFSVAWHDQPVRLITPLNLRPVMGMDDECALLVSSATSVIDGRATSFWDLAYDAKIALAAGQKRDAIAAGLSAVARAVGAELDVAGAAELAANAFAHEAVLTNLGVLPFEQSFGTLKLEHVWGPAVLNGMEGAHTIGVTTLDERICLTHTSHSPVNGLLEAMRDVLVEAC